MDRRRRTRPRGTPRDKPLPEPGDTLSATPARRAIWFGTTALGVVVVLVLTFRDETIGPLPVSVLVAGIWMLGLSSIYLFWHFQDRPDDRR